MALRLKMAGSQSPTGVMRSTRCSAIDLLLRETERHREREREGEGEERHRGMSSMM